MPRGACWKVDFWKAPPSHFRDWREKVENFCREFKTFYVCAPAPAPPRGESADLSDFDNDFSFSVPFWELLIMISHYQ